MCLEERLTERLRYVIDHIVPLKYGGADQPSNMQWQVATF